MQQKRIDIAHDGIKDKARLNPEFTQDLVVQTDHDEFQVIIEFAQTFTACRHDPALVFQQWTMGAA